MRIITNIFLIGIVLLLSACAGIGRYSDAYSPVANHNNASSAYLLDAGAKPRLIITRNFDDDLKIFTDQNFVVVGKSDFSGPIEEVDDAVNKGLELQVTHVLLEQKYAYSGSKKAYKFYSGHDYNLVGIDTYRGYPQLRYDRIPNVTAIPYAKEVNIFRQRAVYLVKLKN